MPQTLNIYSLIILQTVSEDTCFKDARLLKYDICLSLSSVHLHPGSGVRCIPSVQNADCRLLQTIVFTMEMRTRQQQPHCFLTLKTMVCSQSAVCILYCWVSYLMMTRTKVLLSFNNTCLVNRVLSSIMSWNLSK